MGECTAIKIQAGFGHLLVSQALPLPISSSATFRVTSPGKKIVQICLLNLVTPFLTLMLTPLKDLSISTNGLAILMPFFLAILLTTPQFAPPNWDESKNWFRSSRNVASNWQPFLAMTSKVTKFGLPTSRLTTSWTALTILLLLIPTAQLPIHMV